MSRLINLCSFWEITSGIPMHQVGKVRALLRLVSRRIFQIWHFGVLPVVVLGMPDCHLVAGILYNAICLEVRCMTIALKLTIGF